MTRLERNEYNYMRRELKNGLTDNALITIRTDAGSECKNALHDLYRSYGFHPTMIATDPHLFDDFERIIYIKDFNYAGTDWSELYSDEEKSLFAAKLN